MPYRSGTWIGITKLTKKELNWYRNETWEEFMRKVLLLVKREAEKSEEEEINDREDN